MVDLFEGIISDLSFNGGLFEILMRGSKRALIAGFAELVCCAVFNYNTVAHSLLQVSATDYNGCIVTAPLERYVTGKDTIKLAGGTTYYFICGTGGHCDAGQKLSITTSGTPGATTPAPSAAAPRINVAAVLQASVAATFAFVAAIALW